MGFLKLDSYASWLDFHGSGYSRSVHRQENSYVGVLKLFSFQVFTENFILGAKSG